MTREECFDVLVDLAALLQRREIRRQLAERDFAHLPQGQYLPQHLGASRIKGSRGRGKVPPDDVTAKSVTAGETANDDLGLSAPATAESPTAAQPLGEAANKDEARVAQLINEAKPAADKPSPNLKSLEHYL